MSERMNIGALAYGITDAMGSVDVAIQGAVALQLAQARLSRAQAERAATQRAIRRVDAKIARLDLIDALGL